jgi:catechol 2,3-dioxygenase-like lactoylglutathione lyase family enzyme
MTTAIKTTAVHHVRLTVSDVARSEAFYTGLLGFARVIELPRGVLLSNGSTLLGLAPPPNAASAPAGDCFDENRVGLDHLSFAVESSAALTAALAVLDTRGVPHGEIIDYGPALGICVLAFRDPDNIQLELTAPRA